MPGQGDPVRPRLRGARPGPGWANSATSNKGLTLRASTSDSKAWKRLAGSTTANPPTLYVTHSAYGATYSIPNPNPNPPVMQNAAGKVKIKVTNTSAMTWASSDYYLIYSAYNASTGKVVRQDRAATLSTNVARLSSVTLDAVIKAMPAGRYIVDFSMMHRGGPSFVTENVAPARLVIEVFNTPPVIKEVYPPNGYSSPTLTPQLWGEAIDLDAPKAGLTYNFQVCPQNDDGTSGICFTSGYTSAFA